MVLPPGLTNHRTQQLFSTSTTLNPKFNLKTSICPDALSETKLYFKLKVMARDERAKERMADIKLIEFENYGHMEKTRANAHAALHYAKQVHADRPKVTVIRKDGCKFTCSSEFKAVTAIQKNAYYNRYQKSNLNYQASIETKDTDHLTTVV